MTEHYRGRASTRVGLISVLARWMLEGGSVRRGGADDARSQSHPWPRSGTSSWTYTCPGERRRLCRGHDALQLVRLPTSPTMAAFQATPGRAAGGRGRQADAPSTPATLTLISSLRSVSSSARSLGAFGVAILVFGPSTLGISGKGKKRVMVDGQGSRARGGGAAAGRPSSSSPGRAQRSDRNPG